MHSVEHFGENLPLRATFGEDAADFVKRFEFANVPFMEAVHADLMPDHSFPSHGTISSVGGSAVRRNVHDMPLRIRVVAGNDAAFATAISLLVPFLNSPTLDVGSMSRLSRQGIGTAGADLPEAAIPLLRLGWTTDAVLGGEHMPIFGAVDETDLIRPTSSRRIWAAARRRTNPGVSIAFNTTLGDFDGASTRRIPATWQQVAANLPGVPSDG